MNMEWMEGWIWDGGRDGGLDMGWREGYGMEGGMDIGRLKG